MSNTLFAHSLLNRNWSASFFFWGVFPFYLGRTPLGFTHTWCNGKPPRLVNDCSTSTPKGSPQSCRRPQKNKKERERKEKKPSCGWCWTVVNRLRTFPIRGGGGGCIPKWKWIKLTCATTYCPTKSLFIPNTASCWTGTVKVVG